MALKKGSRERDPVIIKTAHKNLKRDCELKKLLEIV